MKTTYFIAVDSFWIEVKAEYQGPQIESWQYEEERDSVGERIASGMGGSYMYAQDDE